MATVNTVVDRGGYVFRGQSIPKGRVVRMDQSTFDETQKIQPSYFRLAKEGEVNDATDILDLSTIEETTAKNVVEAERAEVSPTPTPSRRATSE